MIFDGPRPDSSNSNNRGYSRSQEPAPKFDLVEYQQMVRDCNCPRSLYLMTEALAAKYQRAEIGKYELDETMDLIKARIKDLEALKRQVNA